MSGKVVKKEASKLCLTTEFQYKYGQFFFSGINRPENVSRISDHSETSTMWIQNEVDRLYKM